MSLRGMRSNDEAISCGSRLPRQKTPRNDENLRLPRQKTPRNDGGGIN